MRTTFSTPVSADTLSAAAQDYDQRGWTVAETANGLCLITDEDISAIELSGELVPAVRRYLRANELGGPRIEIPGPQPREIHLVTGASKAQLAIAALRKAGAVVYTDGAGVPLPPTHLSAGCATWSQEPKDARWLPPVVAIAAAVRAASKSAPAVEVNDIAC